MAVNVSDSTSSYSFPSFIPLSYLLKQLLMRGARPEVVPRQGHRPRTKLAISIPPCSFFPFLFLTGRRDDVFFLEKGPDFADQDLVVEEERRGRGRREEG